MNLSLGNKKKSVGYKSGENIGVDLIVECLVLPRTALLIQQYEVLCCPERGTASYFLKLRSYLTNSLNEMRQYWHIIFLIHHLTWWNRFFVNDSPTGEECDQHHFVL
jgi:hypothetical protein